MGTVLSPGRPCRAGEQGTAIQPDIRPLLAQPGLQRQLHAGHTSPQSMTLPSLTRPAAVLFDLDGTLLDSAPDLAAAANAMRTARHLDALPLQHYRPFIGTGARGMLRLA